MKEGLCIFSDKYTIIKKTLTTSTYITLCQTNIGGM